jgi:L-rhamnose isomerase/sugar isomerase
MLSSAQEITTAFAKALLVDRSALHAAQEANDVMLAYQILRRAYRTDVSPILALARMQKGGAIEPLSAYRASGWRASKAQTRLSTSSGAGIV